MGIPTVAFWQFLKIILPGFYVVTMLLAILSSFFGLALQSSLDETVLTPLFLISGLLMGILIDSVDLINSRSRRIRRWLPEILFFQDNYPSFYLVERCRRRMESDQCEVDCERVLKGPEKGDYRFLRVWFYVFDNIFPEYLRTLVLTQGHICRVVLYFKLFSLIFGIVALLILAGQIIIGSISSIFLWWMRGWVEALSFVKGTLPRLGWETALIVATLTIAFLFHRFNHVKKTDKGWQPTGFWRGWRDICADQKFWLELNEEVLTDIVCQGKPPAALQGAKSGEK